LKPADTRPTEDGSVTGLPALTDILHCLRKHGERLDSEIAEEMGLPLATVRQRLAGLAATGAVVTCNLTRFEDGKRIEGWLCRVSGYIPPSAPGRKPKAPA
jgi:transcription initiation factor IIE alpha subunit